jgi:serine/threonine-protein kinase
MLGEEPTVDASQSPTLTKDTALGVILGTAAYMSPEQARGKPLDKRTDIWAFGCCLYEALAGEKAFGGETVSDTIGAILRAEPAWHSLPNDIPPNLQRMLRRCLDKDSNQRLHDVADARIEIDELLSGTATPLAQPQTLPSYGVRFPWLFLSFALGVAVAALLTWFLTRAEPTIKPISSRVSIVLPENAAMPYEVATFALSPDGRHLAYLGENQKGAWQLFLRDIDTNRVQPVPGTSQAYTVLFSPDGNWIGFNSERAVKKVSIRGGPPQTICTGCGTMNHWGPDDRIYFNRAGIFAVPASGGPAEPVTELDKTAGELAHWTPFVLPNGKGLLYTVYTGGSLDAASIAFKSFDSGKQKTIIPTGFNARFLPTGHIVYTQGRSLMAVPFDLDSQEVTGDPVLVQEDILVDFYLVECAATWSNNGTFAFLEGNYEDTLVRVERSGQEQRLLDETGYFLWPRLSSDGKRIAVTLVDGNSPDIWIGDLDRGTMTRLTFGGDSLQPVWAPGDERVVYRTFFETYTNLHQKAIDGSREAELLLSTPHDKSSYSFSPDGRYLAFSEERPDSNQDIGLLSLDSQSEPRDFLVTPFNEMELQISPDGNWAAYQSDESGVWEVYIQPFPELGEKRQASVTGGQFPTWSRDGRELFFQNEGKLFAVSVTMGRSLHFSKPRIVLENLHQLRAVNRNYDVFPDAQSFLMVKTKHPAYTTEIHVVLNWFEELKRLVPTN